MFVEEVIFWELQDVIRRGIFVVEEEMWKLPSFSKEEKKERPNREQ